MRHRTPRWLVGCAIGAALAGCASGGNIHDPILRPNAGLEPVPPLQVPPPTAALIDTFSYPGGSIPAQSPAVPPPATPFSLRVLGGKVVSLDVSNVSLREVFGVLTQQTGVRFIFDNEVKQERLVTLMAERLPVAAAMDLVLVQLQLARQVLSDNMVVVYPNTLEKQRDYQQQMVQTFYLTNIDPRKAAEMLRTMLNVRTLYVDDVSSAVLIRDTPETIEMARRLLSSLDVPEAEVMMELEVLEISRGRLEQLGIRYPELVTATPTALAGQNLVMADLQYQNSNTLQISNVPVTVDFKRVLSNSNLLASPRIRARNHEKARILIGTRVPVITNTVTATSLQPVVTGSVQYVDAGLTLDVEPTIYRDGDVSMRINLEVSSIIKEVTSAVSGTLAYQMGTRTATTSLRLKNGETQILGGLISDTERGTADRIPGLGDIPLLGRLFGTKKKDGEKTEIVLSITPRIVRPIRGVVDTAAPFWYGMENSLGGGPPVQLPLEIQAPLEALPMPQVMHEYGKPR